MTASAGDRQRIRQDWVRQYSRAHADVLDLHHHRAIWREMRDAIDADPADPHGYFADHYTSLYVEAQTIRVRRLVKRGRNDQRSLGALIQKIGRNLDVLTRTEYIAGCDDEWLLQRAHDAWTKLCGEGETIEAEKIRGYLERMDHAVAIADHADRRVAHIADRTGGPIPTYADLDQAIDEVAEVHRDWGVILTGGWLAFFEPVIQGDWKAPFRRPLFPRLP